MSVWSRSIVCVLRRSGGCNGGIWFSHGSSFKLEDFLGSGTQLRWRRSAHRLGIL
ncbi:hypothetical protein Pmar_PMAR012931, partial [Perkinsus marinus ATCC 50983]